MGLQRTGPRACGHLGPGGAHRLTAMAPDLPVILQTPLLALASDDAVAWPQGAGASWAPRPLPADISGPSAAAARRFDAVSVTDQGDHAELHGGISGAVPIYLDTGGGNGDGNGHRGASFSSSLQPLLAARNRVRPDWDGWAQMLAAGAPLGGTTTVAGISRLRPWERVQVDQHGTVTTQADSWPWLDLKPGSSGSTSDIAQALDVSVQEVAEHTALAPLLSGGWDSRILTALAAKHSTGAPPTARTTSSDTGTVMEELIAAKVAEHLGLDHRILMPRRDRFAADVRQFAHAVDFQTSFHIWFVPVQRDLGRADGTTLDGLGGGLFVGGAFSDPPGDQPVLDRRFGRLTHYLKAAPQVLTDRGVQTIRDRTRAAFDDVATPLVDHPFASTFTAYLNRTLPGISLAPYGLLAASTTVATPFVDDRVVTAALQFPATQHADGRLYPKVLAHLDPVLAQMPTAEDLAPWPRPHPRRVGSAQAARAIRDLVLAEPVRPLINDDLATAEVGTWIALLNTTGGQHLLRALAVMSLWFTEHENLLGGKDAQGLLA